MLNLVANGPSGYNLTNSLRFRSSASAYLNRTPASATNRSTWTWSGWIKLGALGANRTIFGAGTASSSTGLTFIGLTSSDTLQFYVDTGTSNYSITTTQVFRDPSAWYHIVGVLDTTQATAANRLKLYVNGSQITAFGTATYPAQNDTYAVNNTQSHRLGNYPFDSSRSFDGYLTEINFIDGQALTPSSFGSTNSTTGVWQPARYSGSYGTNGFYLKFSNIALTSGSNTGLGQDYSGNGNYWNTNNISVTAGTTYDAMTDVPTLTSATVANYAVLNPIYSTVYTGSVLAANLQINSPTTDGFCPSTIAVSSGKWYYEATMTNSTAASFIYGIVKTTAAQAELRNVGTGNGYSYLAATGVKSDGSGGAGTAYGATFTTNDVMGCAFDLDSGSITFYKNGVSQGVAYTGISGEFMAAIGDAAGGSGGQTAAVNFGQRPFTYTPPTGYVALNTYNLPTSTIVKGNKYMDATLYAGNTTTVTATNAGGFKPDLVWIKDRTSVAQHVLTDSVRGTSAQLFSSLTNAEQSNSTYVTSFNSNGFTVGVGNSGTGVVNNTGDNFVGWQWQSGQGTTSSNTSGTITSTVSVNASAGFSIVTYTGTGANATVGHGLGVAPGMVIVKKRSAAGTAWMTWHKTFTGLQYLDLSSTGAVASFAGAWNSTIPTSSVISLGTLSDTNASGATFVAYCWAEIAGFSKFGSYTGNGSADGVFVYTGFLPKYIMIKSTSIAGEWAIYDIPRDLYNPMGLGGGRLQANTANAETGADSAQYIDFLSNGFKIRNTSGFDNQSSATYIYAAFASNPFKNSNAF